MRLLIIIFGLCAFTLGCKGDKTEVTTPTAESNAEEKIETVAKTEPTNKSTNEMASKPLTGSLSNQYIQLKQELKNVDQKMKEALEQRKTISKRRGDVTKQFSDKTKSVPEKQSWADSMNHYKAKYQENVDMYKSLNTKKKELLTSISEKRKGIQAEIKVLTEKIGETKDANLRKTVIDERLELINVLKAR